MKRTKVKRGIAFFITLTLMLITVSNVSLAANDPSKADITLDQEAQEMDVEAGVISKLAQIPAYLETVNNDRGVSIEILTVSIPAGIYRDNEIDWSGDDIPAGTSVYLMGEPGAKFIGHEQDGETLISCSCEDVDLHIFNIHGDGYCTMINLQNTPGEVINCEFQDYYQGVLIQDSTGNRIYGCHFQNIGNKYNSSSSDTGAIVFNRNVTYSLIRNNHFINIENTSSNHPARLHAIYIAHNSHHNTIYNNRFKNVSGDVIRFRDRSGYNTVEACKFEHAGYTAYCSDWFRYDDPTGLPDEYQSYGNQFINNKVKLNEKGYWNHSNFQNIVIYTAGGGTGSIGPANPARLLESGTTTF